MNSKNPNSKDIPNQQHQLLTIPDNPNSSWQKYRLTTKGKSLKGTIRID